MGGFVTVMLASLVGSFVIAWLVMRPKTEKEYLHVLLLSLSAVMIGTTAFLVAAMLSALP